MVKFWDERYWYQVRAPTLRALFSAGVVFESTPARQHVMATVNRQVRKKPRPCATNPPCRPNATAIDSVVLSLLDPGYQQS
jgi:hypothetical protein